MKNEPINHEKPFAPSHSGAGNNAYYLRGCETVQRSPSYASCLFKIGEHEAGRIHEIYRDCNTAIEQGKCMAKEMREEEQLKGTALYYFPRTPPEAVVLSSSVAGDFGVLVTNLTPPALVPKTPKPASSPFGAVRKSAVTEKGATLASELAADGYAAAITAAVATTPTVDMAAEVKRVIEVTAEHAQVEKPVAPPPMQAGESPLQYARRIAASRT